MMIQRFPFNPVFENLYLTGYLLTAKPLTQAVLIIPGGAFLGIDEDEMEPVIMTYLHQGHTVFTLNYSIGAPYARFPAPFEELMQAIRFIIENAHGLRVHSDRLKLCGIGTGAFFINWWSHQPNLEDAFKCHFELETINPIHDFYTLKDILNQPIFLEMVYRATFGTASPSEDQLERWVYAHRKSSS